MNVFISRILGGLALPGVFLATPPPAMAASITDGHLKLVTQNGMDIIIINNEIVSGDFASFSRLAQMSKPITAVVLNSAGGNLVEGLQIGEEIKSRKFMTVADGLCASSCAYAWLAGARRGITNGSKVAFHAPFSKDDVDHADSAAGVLVGQYFAEIGIDVKTSMTISGHGPDDYYVIPSSAVNPIVSFDVIDMSQTQVAQGHTAPATQTPPSQQASVMRPTAFVMQCSPTNSLPYTVGYGNGKATVIGGKTSHLTPYNVEEIKDNPGSRVMYVKIDRPDQNRTLYLAFDYSRRGSDVSAIRVMAPGGYDAKDKCAMNWELTK